MGNLRDAVSFSINGTKYSVSSRDDKLTPESRLVDYIRDQAGLKGTKWTCREGGCGSCVVSVRTKDPQSGQETVRAVNSCLTPVYSCDGWDISTVENLGNRRDGYHPIQRRLATLGGTQCGFCSSGMVMNMYSLATSGKELTAEYIENSLDGSICRCTGYRPIYDAFKTFTADADPAVLKKCQDIEDLCATSPVLNAKAGSTNGVNGHSNDSNGHTNGASSGDSSESKCCKTGGTKCCSGPCASSTPPTSVELIVPSGEKWNKVADLKTAFETVKLLSGQKTKYRIVAGNTGTGVYKNDGPYNAYVEINSVPDLRILAVNKNEAVMGAAVTLSSAMEFLQELSKTEGFAYADGMSRHIRRVANTPVRNFGTIAGNIMIKHAHQEFPSDIFLLLETVGAKAYVASTPADIRGFTLVDLLKVDMNGKLIVYFTLPKRCGNYVFRSFKITKRYQNAHAYVNAGFLLKVDPSHNHKVTEKPSITFGGIRPNFLHASDTEDLLVGAELGNPATLEKALKTLEGEVKPDHVLPDASPEYRKALTQHLLYKVFLGIVGDSVSASLKSGADDLPRKLHTGKQVYDTDTDDTPLYKPVPKLESLLQVSGEAEYVNDIPKQTGELAGAFVTATVGNATLKSVDASEALKMPGVVRFLTAKDIPGRNSFNEGFVAPAQEWVFIEDKVLAAGQALGLIVAETREIAIAASKKVKVEYENVQKPVVLIKDSIELAKKEGTFETQVLYPFVLKSPSEPNQTSAHVIKGEFQSGAQAHMQMETHVSLVIPKEDGYTVFSATQWMDHVQGMIASALNIPNNTIDVQVRRLGGAYGAKITRATQIAVAAAVAAYATRRPVRVVMDLETNLEMIGKRCPYYTEYEVGFDDSGKIDALQANIIADAGMFPVEILSAHAAAFMQNCYATNGWKITPGVAITNTHTNAFCRAPGVSQGISAIENIMEHIADVLQKDPVEVRKANYLKPGDDLFEVYGVQEKGAKFEGTNLAQVLVEEITRTADYDARKVAVEEFNVANRWRKRGLALVPMRFVQGFLSSNHTSFVAIHSQDGTVSISHGGIECGQGINTKVAQAAAHQLGIPLSKIVIKPSNNLVGANTYFTGASITSELAAYATIRACQQLKERMASVKKGTEDLSWEELVAKCHQAGIDLRATYMYSKNDDDVKPYSIYGCVLTEVEVDILTGEYKISRLDLIEDVGKSLSPEVDIGQIEGALVMGLGFWTEEKIIFDPDTGRLLTRNTWEYKVPFPKSIPEEFNVTIMRNAPNPFGVLRSKATGEPAVCLAVAVLFAIKNAIKAARKDAGNTEWFQLDGPVTPEDIVRLSLTNPSTHFTY